MDTNLAPTRSPLRFFALLFALTIPFWLAGSLVGPAVSFPMGLSASSLQFVCPLVAALILAYWEGGPGGVKRLLGRVPHFKSIEPKLWYAPTVLLMPLLYTLSYGVMRLVGRSLPEPHISLLSIPVLFVLFFFTATAEEVGWSGYATDPAQHRWGALGAGIIIGLVWAIWHIVPDIQAHRSPTWIAWHRLGSVAQRLLIVWLYNNTGKSLLAPILFHDMDNVGVFSFPNNGSHHDPAITGALTVIVAAIVTLLCGAQGRWPDSGTLPGSDQGPPPPARLRSSSPPSRRSFPAPFLRRDPKIDRESCSVPPGG